METVLTEEALQIKEAVQRYFLENAPVGALRKIRDHGDPLGYSPEIWADLTELGVVDAAIPEDSGGLGAGYATLGAIFEEAGRTLTASPLLGTAVLGASAIELSETSPRAARLLGEIASGNLIVALALEEGEHHAPTHIETSADMTGGYILNGRKTCVIDGHIADSIIVLARTSGQTDNREGLSLFIVDPSLNGVKVEKRNMADSRNWATVKLEKVEIPAECRLGEEGQAGLILDKVLDRARLCLAAEMLGSAIELFERTLEYLKQRKQFGAPIGSFQALKHRCVDMFTEIELTKSVVRAGLSAMDEESEVAAKLASLAKARANDTLFLLSNESIQMHGGIGVTDELDLGFFLKRARTSMQTFGSSQWHRDRYAQLDGY